MNTIKEGEGVNMILFIIFIIAGFVLVIVSLIIRAKTGGKYEIQPVDLILLLIPVFLWLFATGKITKFNIAGFEVETINAFIGASEKPIEFKILQISSNLIDEITSIVEKAEKSDVEQIPELIKKKTEALEFRIGHGGYWGPAIQKYFESLGAAAFLKYVIIYDKNKTLFGVYDARTLLVHLQNKEGNAYQKFAQNLNRADERDRITLQMLPGFLSVEDSVTRNSHKRAALENMERLNTDILPVVNKDKQFVGIVERNRITASLIIDVTKAMEKLKTGKTEK